MQSQPRTGGVCADCVQPRTAVNYLCVLTDRVRPYCQPMGVDGLCSVEGLYWCVLMDYGLCSTQRAGVPIYPMHSMSQDTECIHVHLCACCNSILFPIGMQSSVGILLENQEDPELRKLAWPLQYRGQGWLNDKDKWQRSILEHFQCWKTWAEARQGVPSFPAQDIYLVLYLQHVSESFQSNSVVEETVHAVEWLHQIARLPSHSRGTPIVQATLMGQS